MMWRHRFATDEWGWELPGGIVEAGEDGEATARREVEEETGWRPRPLAHLVSFQPMPGMVDTPHEVYIGHDAELVGGPTDAEEAARIDWLPVGQVLDLRRLGCGDDHDYGEPCSGPRGRPGPAPRQDVLVTAGSAAARLPRQAPDRARGQGRGGRRGDLPQHAGWMARLAQHGRPAPGGVRSRRPRLGHLACVPQDGDHGPGPRRTHRSGHRWPQWALPTVDHAARLHGQAGRRPTGSRRARRRHRFDAAGRLVWETYGVDLGSGSAQRAHQGKQWT